MPADDIVIQTRGLFKSYKDVLALDSLDLTVQKNSLFGFLGPNGAGKTTTMKLLLGLIRPTGGSETVFGQSIVRDNLAIRVRGADLHPVGCPLLSIPSPLPAHCRPVGIPCMLSFRGPTTAGIPTGKQGERAERSGR